MTITDRCFYRCFYGWWRTLESYFTLSFISNCFNTKHFFVFLIWSIWYPTWAGSISCIAVISIQSVYSTERVKVHPPDLYVIIVTSFLLSYFFTNIFFYWNKTLTWEVKTESQIKPLFLPFEHVETKFR